MLPVVRLVFGRPKPLPFNSFAVSEKYGKTPRLAVIYCISVDY